MSTLFNRSHRRPPRFLAEIVTANGRLIRRERFTTRTAAEAVKTWREIVAPYMRDPRARRVEFYETDSEPTAPPVVVLPIYAPPN